MGGGLWISQWEQFPGWIRNGDWKLISSKSLNWESKRGGRIRDIVWDGTEVNGYGQQVVLCEPCPCFRTKTSSPKLAQEFPDDTWWLYPYTPCLQCMHLCRLRGNSDPCSFSSTEPPVNHSSIKGCNSLSTMKRTVPQIITDQESRCCVMVLPQEPKHIQNNKKGHMLSLEIVVHRRAHCPWSWGSIDFLENGRYTLRVDGSEKDGPEFQWRKWPHTIAY